MTLWQVVHNAVLWVVFVALLGATALGAFSRLSAFAKVLLLTILAHYTAVASRTSATDTILSCSGYHSQQCAPTRRSTLNPPHNCLSQYRRDTPKGIGGAELRFQRSLWCFVYLCGCVCVCLVA